MQGRIQTQESAPRTLQSASSKGRFSKYSANKLSTSTQSALDKKRASKSGLNASEPKPAQNLNGYKASTLKSSAISENLTSHALHSRFDSAFNGTFDTGKDTPAQNGDYPTHNATLAQNLASPLNTPHAKANPPHTPSKHALSDVSFFAKQCFEGKRFVVTGASSGIGAHIALTLNALGAEILALGRDREKLESKRAKAQHKEGFIPIVKDISDFDGLDKYALNLAKEYGSANGAVLSAGLQQIAPISSVLSVEGARTIFDVNYFGNLQILKGLLDKRAQSAEGASFVWISSNASVKAQKGIANYSASKAAVVAATRTIALEIAPKYRINAISPGFVLTEMIESWSKVYDSEYIESMDRAYPLGVGAVEDISPLVCFLLSPASAWITGQNIVIDGGGSL